MAPNSRVTLRSLRFRNTTVIAAFAAVASASFTLASCFSEKTTAGPLPLAGDCTVPNSAAGTVVVLVRNFTFIPEQVTIKRGSKVTWVNCEDPGSDAHSATSDVGIWDSPSIPVGAVFTRTFNDATGNVFNYHCTPHPFMKGTINVE